MHRFFRPLTLAFALALTSVAFVACDDDEDAMVVTVDTARPQGTFTAMRAGAFVEQNMTGSTGMAMLGTDAEGTPFLRFNEAFTTNFNTGTVTVYLSTSETFTVDPGNGNPDLMLVGPVRDAGENFFRLDSAPGANFSHVILWCASANVPFGFAELN